MKPDLYPLNEESQISRKNLRLMAERREEVEIIKKNGNSALSLAEVFIEARAHIIIFGQSWNDIAFHGNPGKELKKFVEKNGTKLTILFKEEQKIKPPGFLSAYLEFITSKVKQIIVLPELAEAFFGIYEWKDKRKIKMWSQYPIIADGSMCQLRFFPGLKNTEEMFSCTTFGEKNPGMVSSNLTRLNILIEESLKVERARTREERAERKLAFTDI